MKNAWTDEDVCQLDGRTLESRLEQQLAGDVDIAGDLLHPAPRPMAEHDKRRTVETEAERPQPLAGVRGRTELVRDRGVEDVGAECALHGRRLAERPGLDPVVLGQRPHGEPASS